MYVFVAVVNGLNNFQVGCIQALPAAGDRVDLAAYRVTGSWNDVVSVGLQVVVDWAWAEVTCRYVIVQSRDTEAEQLCVADICVVEGGQHLLEFVLLQQYCLSKSRARFTKYLLTMQLATFQLTRRIARSLGDS